MGYGLRSVHSAVLGLVQCMLYEASMLFQRCRRGLCHSLGGGEGLEDHSRWLVVVALPPRCRRSQKIAY
jgi:hypothetical protein